MKREPVPYGLQVDEPAMDGTESAHPAWWRGYHAAKAEAAHRARALAAWWRAEAAAGRVTLDATAEWVLRDLEIVGREEAPTP